MPKKPAAAAKPNAKTTGKTAEKAVLPSPRGRKPLSKVEPIGPQLDMGKLAERRQELALMGRVEAAVQESANRLAISIGYSGPIVPEALWDRVSFYQRRSVEDVLELGRTLLMLKEITPLGSFQSECEARGIHRRMAQRFMAVGLRFSRSDSKSLLKAAGTQTKVLELAILDDEELEALKSGESVGDLTLDKIERMGVSELRAELRKVKDNETAVNERASKRQEEIDRLQDQLQSARNFLRVTKPDKVGQRLLLDLSSLTHEAKLQHARIREGLATVIGHADEQGADYQSVLDAQLTEWARSTADLLSHLELRGLNGPLQAFRTAFGAE